ncbi:hypothetical protein FOL47_007609 [Perkinsus chesapeaki]|uniref:Uncharacterized protein n=1 Tax=Perkinsus chesapeaki TaxID=330153 RepID=A0A7J6LJA5_PERCH|nr:hypothetical protein FOL47_007609 [Perkinsus chesapeaki]
MAIGGSPYASSGARVDSTGKTGERVKEENFEGLTMPPTARVSVPPVPKRRRVSERSSSSTSSQGEFLEINVRGRRHSLLKYQVRNRPPTLLREKVEEQLDGEGTIEFNEAQPELFP